jgi:hypothetical protein
VPPFCYFVCRSRLVYSCAYRIYSVFRIDSVQFDTQKGARSSCTTRGVTRSGIDMSARTASGGRSRGRRPSAAPLDLARLAARAALRAEAWGEKRGTCGRRRSDPRRTAVASGEKKKKRSLRREPTAEGGAGPPFGIFERLRRGGERAHGSARSRPSELGSAHTFCVGRECSLGSTGARSAVLASNRAATSRSCALEEGAPAQEFGPGRRSARRGGFAGRAGLPKRESRSPAGEGQCTSGSHHLGYSIDRGRASTASFGTGRGRFLVIRCGLPRRRPSRWELIGAQRAVLLEK